MQWLSKAWADTQQQLGSWSGIFLLAAGPCLALVVHYYLFGREEMMSEINPFISAFAGLGVAALLLFLWNLFAAPYRMERDRADDADRRMSANEAALGALTERLAIIESRKGRLAIAPGQIAYGGQVPERPELSPFVAFAYLKNIGELPMAAIGWHLKFRNTEGAHSLVRPTIVDDVKVDHLTLRHADFLYEKSLIPIPGGGLIGGYLFAMMNRAEQEKSVGFQICCEQTDGRIVESEWTEIHHGRRSDEPGYFPGMGNSFDWDLRNE